MKSVFKMILFVAIEMAIFVLSGVELLRELPIFGESDHNHSPVQPRQTPFPPHARVF